MVLAVRLRWSASYMRLSTEVVSLVDAAELVYEAEVLV